MRYSVDRIEENIAILINCKDGTIKEVALEEVGFAVNEGNILIVSNGKYWQDKDWEERKRKEIQERFEKLRGTRKTNK